MVFTPFERYFIRTKLSLEEVTLRLEENIFSSGTGILDANPDTIKSYRGIVKDGHFKIKRIRGRFAREPMVIISGKVYISNEETILEASIRPTYLVIIIVAIFLLLLSYITIMNVIQLKYQHTFIKVAVEAVVSYAIVYLMPVLMINEERQKFRSFIRDILN